jgi:hypothetical protein
MLGPCSADDAIAGDVFVTQRQEPISPPSRRTNISLLRQIMTPLNITILGVVGLLVPIVEHQIASVLFFVLRPLSIPLVVVVIAAVTSLTVISASLLVGLRPRYLAFGPLQFSTGGVNGWSAGVNRSWRHFVGSVLLVPSRGSFSRSQAIVSAGTGLAASFLVLTGSFFYARSLGWPGINETGMSTQLETMLNAAPIGAGIVFMAELLTAGTVLSSVLRGTSEQVRRMLASMTIASHMAIGQRPRDWEPQLVSQAVSLPDSTADHLMGLSFAYLAAVDHGDYSLANRYLQDFERWLQESAVNVRPYVLSSLAGYASLYHERAWLMAVWKQDLDAASEYLNRAANYNVATTIDMRVKAEVLMLEGDWQTAASVAQAGIDALSDFPIMERWRVPFERDLLQRILNRTRA